MSITLYIPASLSQVSADGEVKLYEACVARNITLLSIAHRPTLKRFHQLVVHVDGTVSSTGKGWWTEELDQPVPGDRRGAAGAAGAGGNGKGWKDDTARQLAAISDRGAQRPG